MRFAQLLVVEIAGQGDVTVAELLERRRWGGREGAGEAEMGSSRDRGCKRSRLQKRST